MTTEITVHEATDLEEVVTQSGLPQAEGDQVKANYLPFLERLQEIKGQSGKINFDAPTDIDEKIARDLRLKTVKIRTDSADVKDARKRIHILKGNLEQAAYNLIVADCRLIEDKFNQVEKAREIAEKKRKAELKIERTEKFAPYESVMSSQFLDFENMSDDDFQKLMDSAQLTLQAKIEAEKKAEEERLAAIEAERKRQEEIRLENERLKKEAEEKEMALLAERSRVERERIEAEKKAEAERKKLEAIRLAEQKQAEAKLKAEQEKARKEKEMADAERAKLQAELKAKQDAELAEKKRIESEEKARIDAEKKLAKAGDKKRLSSWIGSIEIPGINPEGLKPESIEVLNEIQSKHAAFIKWAIEKINSL